MRFIAVRIVWFGFATAAAVATSACVPVERGTVEVARVNAQAVVTETVVAPEIFRADPEELTERALIGGLVGGVLGAGVGAAASANPAFGAIIGGPAGAMIGAAIGAATTPSLPSYAPIPVPAKPVIPRFYDTWPPGYRSPPIGVQLPPPPPEWTPSLEASVPPQAEAASQPAVPGYPPGAAPAPPVNILPASSL